MKKLKVLWYSDSPCVETGFAQVAKNILKSLYATGQYEFLINGINHYLSFYDQNKFPYQIHSGAMMGEPLGKKLFIEMLKHEEFDILFTFNDLGLVNQFSDAISELKKMKKFIWITYSPIDIDRVPAVQLKSFNAADIPVVYTEFGYKVATELSPVLKDKLKVIGHGTEPQVFFPMNRNKRIEMKKRFFNQDEKTFVITNVNRNQWRKDLVRTMIAVREFKKQHIGDGYKIVLYLHSKIEDEGGNLMVQADYAGLKQVEDVYFSPIEFEGHGIPRKEMNNVYNASDVIVSTTLGEGWGLSATEAFAAGVPVVFPRNTSLVEIIGENEERGYLADSGKTINDYQVVYGKQQWYRPTTDINSMVEKLNLVYADWKLATEARINAKKGDIREMTKTEEKINSALDYARSHTWEKLNEDWIAIFELAQKKLKKGKT